MSGDAAPRRQRWRGALTIVAALAAVVSAAGTIAALRHRLAVGTPLAGAEASRVRVVASDDAWIDREQPDLVHGRDALLLAGATRYVAYLRFAPPVAARGARLRLRVVRAGSGTLRRGVGADWREDALDLAHAPPLEREVLARFARVEAGADLVVEVGALPAGPLTIAVIADADGLALAARESASPPVLELEPVAAP